MTNHDHLLLLKLMHPVHPTFLNAMSSDFFTEARGVAGISNRELCFIGDAVNEFAIIESTLVPIRYKSSPSILYICYPFQQSSSPVTTQLRIMKENKIGKSAINHEIPGIRNTANGFWQHRLLNNETGTVVLTAESKSMSCSCSIISK